MIVIQVECEEERVTEILEAVKSLARNPRIFVPQRVPQLPSTKRAFEARAQQIAMAIRPRPNQPMRREILEFVLSGSDTWSDQGGEPEPALRNATGALSKALRPFAPWDESPLEILCDRHRETVPSGPYKGRYQGTRYIPTPLGRRVREILQEWGVLRSK
jgi:hypothetical protein